MKKLSRRQREVKELREQGFCCVEIADKLGMDRKNVRVIANKINMPFSEEEKARSIRLGAEKGLRNQYGSAEDRARHSRDYISKHHPGFEYISGYIGTDKPMELRCKECGNTFIRSAISLRKHRSTQCPFCVENLREQKRKDADLRKIEKKQQAEEQKKLQFWNQSFEQGSLSICPECGSAFYGRRKYCSNKCTQKACNARQKDKRIRKIKDRVIDKDITLQALFRRDNGKCWICEGICDFDDCYRDQNNNFIVGGNYPSIDHVLPLSKGGLHSWNNVKLAHHYCNTIKSNKVVSL